MKTRARLPNPSLVKTHRNYSIVEVARLFDICRATVRRWIDAGLQTLDGPRPILILGAELKNFVRLKRARNKSPCQPGQMYCVKCRAPQRPLDGKAHFAVDGDRLGRLIAVCAVCGISMSRLVSPRKLEQVCGNVLVTSAPAQSRIGESNCAGLSVYFD